MAASSTWKGRVMVMEDREVARLGREEETVVGREEERVVGAWWGGVARGGGAEGGEAWWEVEGAFTERVVFMSALWEEETRVAEAPLLLSLL